MYIIPDLYSLVGPDPEKCSIRIRWSYKCGWTKCELGITCKFLSPRWWSSGRCSLWGTYSSSPGKNNNCMCVWLIYVMRAIKGIILAIGQMSGLVWYPAFHDIRYPVGYQIQFSAKLDIAVKNCNFTPFHIFTPPPVLFVFYVWNCRKLKMFSLV